MTIRKIKNRIFIIVFLFILVFPWLGGGFLRLFNPEKFTALSIVETEKRELQQIEWTELLDTGESISGFVDDRIPFRYTFISKYKAISDVIDSKYQVVATAVGQMLYTANTTEKEVAQVDRGVTNRPIVPGEEVQVVEPEAPVDDNYFPLHTYQDVIIARDGWLFLYGENEIECYQGTNILSDDETQHFINLANALQKICQATGKELYIFIAPNKSQVYYQYMPTVEVANSYRRIQQLNDRFHEGSTVPFLYPLLEEMEASNKNQVYYKYDSHWNHLGALYGTNALYAAMGIEQTDPLQWVTGQEDAEKYELYTYMGIPDSMVTHDDIEFTMDYRPEVTVNGLNLDAMICRTTSNGPNQKKLCVIGDSFRVNMMPYLAKDFTQCTFAHRDYMGSIPTDIKNADIIVIEAVERYDYEAFHTIQRVINLF